MNLHRSSVAMVSGEQAVFEAHIVRGAALSRIAAITAAFDPMVRAIRELGESVVQATAGLRRAVEQFDAARTNIRAPG